MKNLFFLIFSLLYLSTYAQSIFDSKERDFIDYKTSLDAYKEIGDGDVITDFRETNTAINQVIVGNGMQLYLTSVESKNIRIEAQKNILPLIDTKFSEGTLTIKLASSLLTSKGIKIYIPFDGINKVTVKEGAYLDILSSNKSKDFNLELMSGSLGNCNLDINDFTCLVMGGSELNLQGTAIKSDILVKGGSSLYGKKFNIKDCIITVLGASECLLGIEDYFKARVENESKFIYYGNPEDSYIKTKQNGIIEQNYFHKDKTK